MNERAQLTEPPRTLPDRVADELIGRVFTGELQPGQTLPAERQLAEALGVDRTSLRIALRQLTRMRVLRPVRGSGITVLDYRTHAGLDFLDAVLDVPGLELGGAFLLEVLEHWDSAMPHLTARALQRARPQDTRRLDALFAAQLALLDRGGSMEELAEIELDVHDALVDMVGDTTLQLMANGTRGLRRRLTLIQLSLADPRAHIEAQRRQLRVALAAEQLDPSRIKQALASYLERHHAALRAHLAALPPNPTRTTRWQRHPEAQETHA